MLVYDTLPERRFSSLRKDFLSDRLRWMGTPSQNLKLISRHSTLTIYG
ncbi:hypothetical protein [Nostoc parmelioides]|uniref:Uncharacterized protein n=1 Tax=Nostoc parmelioides FACHB-3921 TaxID=2692909 RepID=A0ABR8BHU7_9NOSO|nr:hypothetical protein [Nostoc parmelioides]MBD2253458.1 hypothetical protein [Nostoc parmelioides FACHB-3921]